MADNYAGLSGGRYLAELWQRDSVQAAFQQKIIKSINQLAQSLGSNAVGEAAPPDPVQGINVKASGEQLQVTLIHNTPKTRAINYFTEIDTDPNFPNALVHNSGPSRSPLPFNLPTYDDQGNKVKYYVRAYAQYPNSKPTARVVFGGHLNPSYITMGGNTKMTLLGSTGSGTSSNTGQQGGSGFGIQPVSPLGLNTSPSVQPQTSQNAPIPAPTAGAQTVSAVIDFGGPSEDSTAQVTVTATWVTASSIIVVSIAGGTTDHPDSDEPAVEGITVAVDNIVAGSFQVSAYAPYGTFGQYNVFCVGA